MSQQPATPAMLRVAPGDRDLARALDREEVRAALEAQLPAWLRPRRWFGGQTRQLTGVRIERWLPLGGAPTDAAVLCVVSATDAAGATTRHPLFLAADADGTVGEALEQPAARQQLLAVLLSGGERRGAGLRLVGETTGPVDELAADVLSRLIGAEQSNSSIVYGDRAILKLYRRLESGPNPEVELGRYLSVEAGFAAVPRVYATARLVSDDGLDAALLILQAFVPNDGDGWAWALAQAGAAYAAAADGASLERWFAGQSDMLTSVVDLGRTTARMHAALAAATADDLRPRSAGPADLANWGAEVRQEAQVTTAAIARARHDDDGLRLAVEAAQVFAPPEMTAPGLQTRVHGDYHLGQVIRTRNAERGMRNGEDEDLASDNGAWMILDFEGEPARPLPARRRHQHPLVDLAGMVRSWNYAARAALPDRPGAADLADAWEAVVRGRFLAAYWAEADAAPIPFLPPARADREALLRLFELTKALYEVRYEFDNRPAMVTIPGDAVKRLMTNDE
jgi:trehalose synthase-fused probable maltokinase